MLFHKRARNTQSKDGLPNQWWWENLVFTHKNDIESYLSPYTKLNSKRSKDFNGRFESLNPLKENTGESFKVQE